MGCLKTEEVVVDQYSLPPTSHLVVNGIFSKKCFPDGHPRVGTRMDQPSSFDQPGWIIVLLSNSRFSGERNILLKSGSLMVIFHP